VIVSAGEVRGFGEASEPGKKRGKSEWKIGMKSSKDGILSWINGNRDLER
jgi:hypothetical protein